MATGQKQQRKSQVAEGEEQEARGKPGGLGRAGAGSSPLT